MTTDSLSDDHRWCAALLRRSGSSFALPIRLLPPAKRRGTTALYAFCRRADDIVDDAIDRETATTALDRFEAEVRAALVGTRSIDPVVRALADTVQRFSVPAAPLLEVLAGVRMDIDHVPFATVADLELYCSRVASAVGTAAVHIWGYRSPRALDVAHDCGIAFQLTNILRDIPEDRARGRLYIPASDLVAAGCSAADLAAPAPSPAVARLARLQCARARAHYRRAAELDRLLSTDGRPVFRAMFGVYECFLRAVERAGAAIFVRRVRPATARLLAGAALAVGAGPALTLAVPALPFGGSGHG